MSEIQEIKKEEKKHVSWTVFVWIISIILILFGVVFNQLSKASDNAQQAVKDNTEIKVQLSKISTDVEWIKGAIVKNPNLK
jgi:uncharacterized membrane protein YvbJ